MRNRLAGFAAVGAAAVLVLTACGDGGGGAEQSRGFEDCVEDPNNCNSGEAEQGGEIVWAIDQAPDGYFPWSPEAGSVYTLQATQGILPYFGQFAPDGEYAYNMDVLAEEPQIVNEQPFQTAWRIRDEAVWEDGTTPVSSNDVIMSWMMSTPEEDGHCTGCRPRAFEELIENIEATDEKSFTITYKEGVADPEWFAFNSVHGIIGGFAPVHVAINEGFISGDTPDQWDPAGLGEYFEFLNDNPPEFSAGPWMIQSFDIDTEVIKIPNPAWYGAAKPTLERQVLRFLTDESTWVPALQNAELHGASPAGWSGDVIRQVQGMENVRVHMQAGPSWEHIDMNMDNEWLGGDVELRRAIFTAIDAADIAQRNFGDLFPDVQLRTNHVFSQSSQFHQDVITGTGQGSGDVEAARGILEAAGYEGMDGGPGSLTKDGEEVGPFRLRSTTAPARVTAQQLIQGYLGEIGIQADIEPTDDLGGTLGTQDYDIMQFGWSGSPLFFNNGGQYWDSASGSNFGKYSNEQVDALYEQEQQAQTQQESADLHNQMMELVVADAYVLPLYDSPVYLFVTENFVNVRDNTNTSLRALYETHEWGVAAE